jgi:hypothetical protein
MIGECPYCKDKFMAPIDGLGKLPKLGKLRCEECNEVFVQYVSRTEPKGYTLEDAREEFPDAIKWIDQPFINQG